MSDYQKKVKEAAACVKKMITKSGLKIKTAVILGSGLGGLVNSVKDKLEIPYGEIPHFPVSTVKGHGGKLILGTLDGRGVLVMQGRFHYYEGYHMREVTFPVRVMSELKITDLVVTNAAGGINRNFKVGDLMIISDHLNLFGTNPLIGPNVEEWGPRFPDMSEAYSKNMIELCEKTACEEKIRVVKGVYAGFTGPSYETPAEIRYLKAIGADAVGMSTVPEVIVARHAGIKNILGISCVTNTVNGETKIEATHEEVVEAAAGASEKFIRLVRMTLKNQKSQ
jgi:purine-nucleoside phosphorylase